MLILDYITELNLPNFYIAAGAIFQTVWNYYDNNPLNFGIKDVDIIYYDSENISKESEVNFLSSSLSPYVPVYSFHTAKNLELPHSLSFFFYFLADCFYSSSPLPF